MEICKKMEELAAIFPLYATDSRKWEEAKIKLKEIEDESKEDLKQKSRIKWTIDGDANTSFFHGTVNAKVSASRINGLSINNKWVSDPGLVKKEVYNFFKRKFKKSKDGRPPFSCMGINRMSNEEGGEQVIPFSKQEIKAGVWECGSDKAPGPDGFTFSFLKKYWELFENDIVEIFNKFHEEGTLGNGCGAAFIHLITKMQDPTSLSDFCPISLVGVIPKALHEPSKLRGSLVKGPRVH
ncbi:hypothetical protein SSX86_008345 [Deinandra increscens subsp. villosa]|uniref:RNA-directed DNA polymerase, eukaryota, reverse transcriptase zinc-binding domain protein n=1 Tax=Deinandra increscens subsp. villosa TaxID=3103831 RepID=A0AAP0DBI4_9ASTR